jgi:hypothetical protein
VKENEATRFHQLSGDFSKKGYLRWPVGERRTLPFVCYTCPSSVRIRGWFEVDVLYRRLGIDDLKQVLDERIHPVVGICCHG